MVTLNKSTCQQDTFAFSHHYVMWSMSGRHVFCDMAKLMCLNIPATPAVWSKNRLGWGSACVSDVTGLDCNGLSFAPSDTAIVTTSLSCWNASASACDAYYMYKWTQTRSLKRLSLFFWTIGWVLSCSALIQLMQYTFYVLSWASRLTSIIFSFLRRSEYPTLL